MTTSVDARLLAAWEQRAHIRAEAASLWVNQPTDGTPGRFYDLDSLRVQGALVGAEWDRLRAEADRLWAEAILEVRGNIRLEWTNWHDVELDYECHLETGEVFMPMSQSPHFGTKTGPSPS